MVFCRYKMNLCRNLQQIICCGEGALSEDQFKTRYLLKSVVESDNLEFVWQSRCFQMLN